MTTINCLSDCLYQKDGKCTLESVSAMVVAADNPCVYYERAQNKSRKNLAAEKG